MSNWVRESCVAATFLAVLGAAAPSFAVCDVVGPVAIIQGPEAAAIVAFAQGAGQSVLFACNTVSVPLAAAGSAAASTGTLAAI